VRQGHPHSCFQLHMVKAFQITDSVLANRYASTCGHQRVIGERVQAQNKSLQFKTNPDTSVKETPITQAQTVLGVVSYTSIFDRRYLICQMRPQEAMRHNLTKDCRVLLSCLTSASMNNHLLVKGHMRAKARAHILLLARPFRCHMQGKEVQTVCRHVGLFLVPSTLRATMATGALQRVKDEGKSPLRLVPTPRPPILKVRGGLLRRQP